MKKHFDYLIIGIVLALIFGWGYFSYINEGIIYYLISGDINQVTNYLEGFGIIAGIVLILITIIEVIVAPIPPLVLYVVAGILFGTFWGGTITVE